MQPSLNSPLKRDDISQYLYFQNDNSRSKAAMDFQCFWQVNTYNIYYGFLIFLCQGQQFLTIYYWLRDGGGTIDAMEIYEMVKGLFSMSGMEVSEEEVDNCTKEILEAIDVDSDGDITKVKGDNHSRSEWE